MFQEGLFRGKKILITGGGTGLGRAIAERLLGLGAEIAICGRRKAVCDDAAESMMATHGGTVKSYGVDIRDAAAVDAMVAEISAMGRFPRSSTTPPAISSPGPRTCLRAPSTRSPTS